MIGRRVGEVCFFTSMMAFWFGFLFLSDSFFETVVGWKTVFTGREASAVFFAAILAPIAGFIMLIVNGKESLAAEVLKPYGLIILGLFFVFLGYSYPVIIFLQFYIPHSPGVVYSSFALVSSSSLFLSVFTSVSFMLGGFGVYLIGQGIVSMALSLIGFFRKFI